MPPTECPAADGSSPQTAQLRRSAAHVHRPREAVHGHHRDQQGHDDHRPRPLAAPKTVNNFVVLARYHYYDGISFHRVIPSFMLQGGDPRARAAAARATRFGDELPAPGRYEMGSLAMANAGPNTNGSQFFIVSGPDGMRLPPKYSLFGKVVSGMDVVKAINDIGSPTGRPLERVTIDSVVITESD